ncbi:MAG: Rrf2 family transcriptional regulator [Actinobacteria bacterium]|nr:MAG: Rrf2 family transcriptional regulator [Actinomycetota bacterium]
MRVSAKVDYALRAVIELATAGDGPVKGERIAQAQEIPLKFLENILGDLRQAGIVRSQRGVEGGYWLARPPEEISVADVVRTVEGPIANVRGIGPESVSYVGSAERLQDVWIAVRANLRAVLERVTIADVSLVCRVGRTYTIWPFTSSSASACSRVSCTDSSSPSSRTSSTRTSKPRCTSRSTIASCVAPFGSSSSSTSCGLMKASPSRFTGPTNDMTNSFAGAS